MPGLQIGHVAERSGVPATTIRYYATIGLLARPSRSATGYRRYADTTVEELQFIRKAQTLGFSLDEVAKILKLSRAGKAPCTRVLDLAKRHLKAPSAVPSPGSEVTAASSSTSSETAGGRTDAIFRGPSDGAG